MIVAYQDITKTVSKDNVDAGCRKATKKPINIRTAGVNYRGGFNFSS